MLRLFGICKFVCFVHKLLIFKEFFLLSCRYYFWDASQSPAFEICYLLTSMAMFFMIIGFLAVDLFFVGICLYIKALYDELIYMLKQVDEHRTSTDERELQISNCINFHTDILGYSFLY